VPFLGQASGRYAASAQTPPRTPQAPGFIRLRVRHGAIVVALSESSAIEQVQHGRRRHPAIAAAMRFADCSEVELERLPAEAGPGKETRRQD
jgi:hypothetical protein